MTRKRVAICASLAAGIVAVGSFVLCIEDGIRREREAWRKEREEHLVETITRLEATEHALGPETLVPLTIPPRIYEDLKARRAEIRAELEKAVRELRRMRN